MAKLVVLGTLALLVAMPVWTNFGGLSRAGAMETETLYLSGQGKDDPMKWEFYCTGGQNSGKWTTIGVPSNWELQGFGTYNYGTERKKSDEQGMYNREFTVPDSWRDKQIFIVFEGVMTDTEVQVNGQSAGPKHQGGFYRFKYEITELVKSGQNLLEVTVSKVSANRSVEESERMADYWVFGGIYRPVYLEAVPRQFIEWVAIDPRADGAFRANVHLGGNGTADTVKIELIGPNGKPLVEAALAKIEGGKDIVTIQTQARGHKVWTAETPNLYEARLSLLKDSEVIHTVKERFGFRSFEVRKGDGLYLNGQKIRLKGVCRHSFWPDSGRCLSRRISYDDVRLIKEMNMNAVRMSHYPPDEHFLDVCDELGLYVLDELAGWQKPPYDTEIGRKLVKEMVTRDVCHPCILFWDNGNEGGWNRELDGDFSLYDPQQRTVLHPWENFNGIDTDHYENYESTRKKLSGSTLFMPTEFLHGLYDGGLGAGLNDYWKLTMDSPMGAGGFLWALVDEGVVRTDRGGAIDVVGNQAPDGIVGPYRQKEGSFYTIKEVWSPVRIGMEMLPADFDGKIKVENRYDFTNLNECTFEMSLQQFTGLKLAALPVKVLYESTFAGPNIEPHASGVMDLTLPENWRQAEVLYLTVRDPWNNKIWTWSWDVQGHEYYRQKYVETKDKDGTKASVTATDEEIRVEAGNLVTRFAKNNGEMMNVTVDGRQVSFGGGPRLIGGSSQASKVTYTQDDDGILVSVEYASAMKYANWRVFPTGWISLEYQYELDGQYSLFGVNFDFPENKIRAIRWFGRGPNRVWKNRMKGVELGLWMNAYKNDIPGVTWDFPEFKGYYRDWRWVVFETEEGDITVVNGTDDLFLGVYRPNDGPNPANTKLDVLVTGIAFLHGIPPIGNKFDKPDVLGPESQKNKAAGKYKGTVWFHFEPPK
jgi:hypothetical protein